MQKTLNKVLLTATMSTLLLFQPFAAHAAGGQQSTLSPELIGKLLQNKPAAAALQSNAGPLISPRLNTTSADKVKVIVQMKGASIAEGNYASRMGVNSFDSEATTSAIQSQHASFIANARNSGIPIRVTYQYDTVLNGMEVELPANQIPNLAKLPGVKSIYENRTYYAIPDAKVTPSATSPDCKCDIDPLKQIGVPAAWEKGLTGKGIKIGVIDTGVDYIHPDLADAYAGGHDSYFNTEDPYEEIPDEETGNAGTQHGTHVSGTIAGRGVNPTSDIVQKGVAYESELHVYKVLGYDAESGRSSGSTAQVIDGIEHAVKDRMDVINLSLGSDDAKDNYSPDAIAINNAVLAGITAVVANGNAADTAESYYYSMGSPASSQLAISVGAVDSASTQYTATVTSAVYGADGTSAGTAYPDQGLNVMGWRTSQEDFASILGTDEQEAVYVGLGAEKDYADKNVTGKIAFVSRGLLAFVDKIAIAKEHGAKAVVIFNGNATTTDPDTAEAILSESITGRDSWIDTPSLGDSLSFLPAFDMEGTTGRAIARLAEATPGSTIKLAFGAEYPSESFAGDHMATFSSRGPNSDGKLGIKPDFAAPGVNIMSTWPAYGKNDPAVSYDEAYERISGTSMATPHVAGLAVLLKEEHPEWTPFEIRAALANTADEISDEDGIRYDVYSQGAGRVNVAEAIDTPAVLETVESLQMLDINMNPHEVTNYGDNASFGIMKAGDPAKSITLQVNNTSAEEVAYKAEVVLHDEVTSDPKHPIETPDVTKINASLTGLTDGTVTAAALEKKTFALEVAPAADAVDGVYEGDVVLTADGKPTLHIPFVVHVGKDVPDTGFAVQDIQLSSRIVSPDGDGVNDSIDVSFKLAADDINFYYIEIDDLNDQAVGYLQIEGPNSKPFKPGRYSYEGFDGTYPLDVDGNENPGTLKDGTYSLVVVADKIDLSKNAVVREAVAIATFSVQHKSTPPTTTPPITMPTTPTTPTPASAYALTAITGQGLQSVAVKSTTSADVVTVADADLKSAIGTGTAPLAIVVNADAAEGKASKLSLTAAQVVLLAAAPQDSALYLNTGASALELPLSLLKSVPSDSGIELVISPASDQAGPFEAEGKGTSVVGVPVSFEVNVVNGTSVKPLAMPANVFVKRSFTLDKDIQAGQSGVLFIENGKVAPAPAVFTANAEGTATVTVNRPGFSVYAVAKHEVAFSDISTSWAQTRIQALAEKFLINGTTDTTYSPKKSVTRAEFAAMLTRGLGLSAAAPVPFKDVDSSAWYSDSIGSAYAVGLITGYTDGTFRPDGIISRQELAVMLTKASKLLSLKADNGGSRNAYKDESSFGSFAKDSIDFVTSAGLMEGTESNGSKRFDPSATTTREAAATVLYKLLQAGKLI